jgi:hypothetical protein
MSSQSPPADVPPSDEGRHPPGDDPLWNESWYFDFAAADGSLGGYVRLGLYPNLGVSWYWACVVGQGRPLVTVVDHEAPLPRGAGLELRAEGLWCDTICETPLDHWTLGLEAFGVALDDPAEAYRGGLGDVTALGFDLEWENTGPLYPYPGVSRYEASCEVHGEVLVGTERIAFEGRGQRDHSWGVRDWWSFGWTWTAGWLDDGTAFHATRPEVAGMAYEPGYVQHPDRRLDPIGGFTPSAELGDEGLPTSGRMELGDLGLAVEPLAFAPVRLDAPDGRVGRLPRALCRFRADDGRVGHGWTEWNQPPAR